MLEYDFVTELYRNNAFNRSVQLPLVEETGTSVAVTVPVNVPTLLRINALERAVVKSTFEFRQRLDVLKILATRNAKR